MTIATYSQLQTRIADFLNRQDLTAVIPTFITLGEADMNRRLRHYRMVKRARTTLLAGLYRVAQPQDWVQAINIQVTGSRGPHRLEYLSPTDIDSARQVEATGEPRYYSFVSSEIEVAPTPTTDIEVEQIYFGRLPALSDAAPSNWLLASYPDAYLYGSLLHSAPYLDEDARVAVWLAGYERAMAGLEEENRRSTTSGGVLHRRLRTFG